MADYNVNMKQWNGSSFDNVLPLAFNSKALDGKSYDDIIQYAQSKNLLLYTGRYTGTGTYGRSNPNSVTLPFVPILFFMPQYPNAGTTAETLQIFTMTTDYNGAPWDSLLKMKKSADEKTLYWYYTDAYSQYNASGTTYFYAAIGGYDMGGAN